MNLKEFRKALSKVACDRVIYQKGESNVSKI